MASAGANGNATEISDADEIVEENQPENIDHTQKNTRRRNLVGFWILGLCNNFGYVIMLSAAHDILEPHTNPSIINNSTGSNSSLTLLGNASSNSNGTSDGLGCNPYSTGTVLLADILPTLFIKLTAPFYMHKISYNLRIVLCILFAFASFFIVAYSQVLWFSLFGVVCASASSGFGEITLLSFSAHFDKNVISTWASGTGAAGVFGALSYAGLISTGLSPRNTVLVMNIIPVLLGVSFWLILKHPAYLKGSYLANYASVEYNGANTEREQLFSTTNTDEDSDKSAISRLSFREKLTISKSLVKYMVPLFSVYFAEYFINQGLHELIFWKDIWITPAEQYRWYQVDYQVAVLISRSSVNIAPIKNICLLSTLQYVNLLLLLFESFYHFFPTIWIMFAVVFFEGLLGGAVYVNAFYRISKEVDPAHREFCMGITSVADSCGIALAGATSLPTHNALCNYWLHRKTH